jgi:DNA-binding PadR family transcriptional regulator
MTKSPSREQVLGHLPLKPLVLQILLELSDGERHGWSLVREVQQRGFGRIMPGNFYRTLRGMLEDGLIEESQQRPDAPEDDERRRYFALTPLGAGVAAAEARRLQAIVTDARTRKLLTRRG